MNTFAERLKIAIAKRGISQAEAARLCGIAQQSLNYIITNNLNSSKLAPHIASALGINPEWLILGQGKFEENKVYELPIIHSPYMLKKFMRNELEEKSLDYTVININLGDLAFAYLLNAKKMVICSTKVLNAQNQKLEYLNIEESATSVTDKQGELSFPIFEWRIRNVDY
jgi:transcriptional regulator with XRE-family HTH domain